MKDGAYYLKEGAYIEPLVRNWYAWGYLIPPAQSCRYMTKTHKRVMRSFISNAELHVMAAKESVLSGGEFLNCPVSQVGEIQRLVDSMETDYGPWLELSHAIEELEETLRGHTSGESVEPLYGGLGPPLRGRTELLMDMNHHPQYRLIERLLYDSDLNTRSHQSVSLSLLEGDAERPFVFSTPRLPDGGNVHLSLSFDSDALAPVLAARDRAISAEAIESLQETHVTGGERRLETLFTETPPDRYSGAPADEQVHVRFFGHATFLIEYQGLAVLVDPVIPVRCSRYGDQMYSFGDLPEKIDYVFITHNHADHFNIETLLQLRHKVGQVVVPRNNGGTLADPSLRLIAESLGFEVREFADFDVLPLAHGDRVMALPFLGEHGDLYVMTKTVWYFELGGKKIFVGADASNLDPSLYDQIRDRIGELDVLAIGMECVGAPYTWLYGGLYSKTVSKKIRESRRLNGSDYSTAKALVEAFRPKELYVYALGQEPWFKYFMGTDYEGEPRQITESNKLLEYCRGHGILAKRLVGRHEFTL